MLAITSGRTNSADKQYGLAVNKIVGVQSTFAKDRGGAFAGRQAGRQSGAVQGKTGG